MDLTLFSIKDSHLLVAKIIIHEISLWMENPLYKKEKDHKIIVKKNILLGRFLSVITW